MTEAADLNIENHQLTVERRFEAGPPEGLEIVEAGDTVATTKEEEWVSKKTTEITNTKQIETRVKRQVVLEDGKVVEDSGPLVTTNTTEDTETQEHHQTELRKLGDDDTEKEKKALEGNEKVHEDEDHGKWVSVANPDGVVREVKERRVISREETEDTREMEDVQHLGDISDEAFLEAVNSGKSDIREVLRTQEKNGKSVIATGPRLINESHRSKKIIDTEDTKELSSVRPDGRIVTETQRTTEHEEVKDSELPEDAPDQNDHRESHQRFFKVREEEEVDYVADGVKIGHEMRFRAETTEAERRGDPIDDPNWDSLSARAKRRQNVNISKHPQRLKENGVVPTASPLDRKDALTKKPLDFDQEEETRKLETSKWLEHHFGSESRSSRDSLDELDEEIEENNKPKTSFFNVTIKSQPTQEPEPVTSRIQHVNESPRYFAPAPVPATVQNSPENEYHTRQTRYFQGISEWTEREKDAYSNNREPRVSPVIIREAPSPAAYVPERYPTSPPRDYRTSPNREKSPTPPQRKRMQERPQRFPPPETDHRLDNGFRTPSRIEIRPEPLEEPPPDYSPTTPPRAPTPNKKPHQKTRFAVDPPPAKAKSGNIIGQSIRKLVGKIRSASAERKARQQQQQQQRTKRSPSPSYKPGHVIDNLHDNNGMENGGSRRTNSPGPVHRYYLGEDPFGGSIYGRENKYDGVRPARSSRKHEPRYIQAPEEYRSHSTLGRFSKSSGRQVSTPSTTDHRNSQTLPRHLSKHEPNRLNKNDRSNSTINVSFINTVSTQKPIANGGPAKPARTYRSNLSRSKSFNVDLDSPRMGMQKLNLQLQAPAGLKSPGLISSISRSQRDLTTDRVDDGRDHKEAPRFAFGRNGMSENKRLFLKDLRQRAPELYNTLHEDEKEDSWRGPAAYSTPIKNSRNHYNTNGDIYEPPTRLRDTHVTYAPNTKPPTRTVIRRGSNSSTDYSETYHTTTRNDDPLRPTITNTVQSFSKRTLPTKDGRNFQTVESTETKSVTKSNYRGDQNGIKPYKYYENDRKINGSGVRGPVVIEVRNNNYK